MCFPDCRGGKPCPGGWRWGRDWALVMSWRIHASSREVQATAKRWRRWPLDNEPAVKQGVRSGSSATRSGAKPRVAEWRERASLESHVVMLLAVCRPSRQLVFSRFQNNAAHRQSLLSLKVASKVLWRSSFESNVEYYYCYHHSCSYPLVCVSD